MVGEKKIVYDAAAVTASSVLWLSSSAVTLISVADPPFSNAVYFVPRSDWTSSCWKNHATSFRNLGTRDSKNREIRRRERDDLGVPKARGVWGSKSESFKFSIRF